MNILIFVMSMLMIFALLTYARLETYRTTAGIEGEFTHYMESIERKFINASANRLYEKISFSKKKIEDPKEPTKPTRKSSGRISLAPLIKGAVDTEKNSRERAELLALLKSLMMVLYGNQKKFQDFLEKNPHFIEQIFEAIPLAIEALPKDKKIKKAADLSNLELGGGLDEPFYYMLKGCPNGVEKEEVVPLSETSEDHAEDDDEAQEYFSDKSYDSLLNFVTLSSNLKINVYIASEPLLLALYGDPAVVNHLMNRRFQLYHSVEHEEISTEEASQKLKAEFQINEEENILEYRVTGSDPRRYN